MEAYLDNAATTKPFDSVVEAMVEALREDYANPSSLHKKGWEAEQRISAVRKRIADGLKCDAKEIVFTSGGTEANNLALLGTAYARRREGTHVVTTRIEHPSVLVPIRRLEEDGYEVTYLGVDENGRVDEQECRDAVREDTVLVSVMMVNNEMGAVQDVRRLSEAAKGRNPNLVFHVDAIQAYGKYPILPKYWGIDLMSASGHKIHGPKGVGFLYKADKVKMNPILFGGGQERDWRSGTENVPGVAGLGRAVEETERDVEGRTERLYGLKEQWIRGLEAIPGVEVNGVANLSIRETAPHIVSASFDGIRSEVLLHALEEKGVYVSSGSACASNHPAISATLQAIGVKGERLSNTLRFSHSIFTTEEEVEYALGALRELVPVLSRYRRR